MDEEIWIVEELIELLDRVDKYIGDNKQFIKGILNSYNHIHSKQLVALLAILLELRHEQTNQKEMDSSS